jgi:hypothetical protein
VENKKTILFGILALLSSGIATTALLPTAFAQISIGSMGTPVVSFAGAIVLVFSLGGPLLLFFSGLSFAIHKAPRVWLAIIFAAILLLFGVVLFWGRPGHGIIVD